MTQIQESPLTEEETPFVELVQGEESREQEDDLSSFFTSEDRKDFAAMNGVDIEIDAHYFQSEILQPEEIITTRAVSQNPLLKMAVISGGILVFIMLIGGVINGSMNALNMGSTKKIEPSKNSQEIAEEPVKDETGQTKTALALTSQNVKFQEIRDHQAQSSATSTPSPTFTPVAVAPPPTTTPIQRTQPISVRANPTPPKINTSSTRSSPVFRPQSQSQPLARITPTRTPTVKALLAPMKDPMQQWLAAANVGSFSANSTTQASGDLSGASGIEGGIGRPSNRSEKADKLSQNSESENVDYGRLRVLVGTRALGKLETPIAWSGNTENQSNQNYLIQLSQPLFASDGSEALPKGSYIVAQVYGRSQSEYIQLQAVSALINTNGNTEEKSLPSGAILILAKNGKLLKAESRKGSDVGNYLFSSLLAGVAKAAQIQNNPQSQTTTSSSGFSSSTTTNDNKNLTAGFAEGALGEIVRGIQSQNQQQTQQLQGENQVFVIEAGKSVQIFVNKTIGL